MTNTIINNINADIISKANEANKAETDRIVNTYQQMWGNGDSFIANDMAFLFGGAQRSGLNDDEEMAAAVKAAETDLIYKVIIKTWFKDMSRADAVAICNKLFGSRDNIQIFSATLTANDVARNWNAEHSNEKPIYMTTRAMEETFGSIEGCRRHQDGHYSQGIRFSTRQNPRNRAAESFARRI